MKDDMEHIRFVSWLSVILLVVCGLELLMWIGFLLGGLHE